MKLILGSSSKFRRMVMDQLGHAYEVVSPDIDEKAIRCANPKELVLAIANAKADAICARVHEPAFVITADQVVTCGGQIYEKPATPAEAKKFVLSYNDAPAVIVNGMTITNTATGARVQGTDVMTVWYGGFTDAVAEQLSQEPNALLSAGGFRFENPVMKSHMIKTDGTTDASMGLPIKLLKKLLLEHGYEI